MTGMMQKLRRIRNKSRFAYFNVVPKKKMPFDGALVIGIYKTGTTSMHHFMRANGLRHLTINSEVKARHQAGDWDYIDWIASRYHSFDDNPWNQLDLIEHFAKKPGDYRFILTTRDPQKWFDSFVKHQQRVGDVVPAESEREDTIKFMVTDRNETLRQMMARYDRPLLEVDVTADPDAPTKIVKFLDLEDRGIPFPHMIPGK